ncbi:MAG: DNA polymerase III subunit chi [Rubellimicrobium sp.]|nr:DNA polymerase III subunit chi [Rubellimicrobium sp.]
MGEVYFYHLTTTSLEAALLPLVTRALGQNWRIEIRGRSAAMIEALDRALWLGPEDGFVPHGIAGGVLDDLQPVLLTTTDTGVGAACVMAVEGAELAGAEVMRMARACVLFDGRDEAQTEQAREQWRRLTEAGCGAKYWAQVDGRWVMKQERASG